jgi:stress response protein YsnF
MKKNNGYLTIGVAAGLFTATVVGLSIASYIKYRKIMSKRLSEDIKSKYLQDSPPLLSSAHSTNGIEENQAKQEDSESSHIPLIEEKLNISKREVTYKEATLIKEPVTETKTFEVPVTHEELIVERRHPTDATTSQDELKSPVTTKEEIKIPLIKNYG